MKKVFILALLTFVTIVFGIDLYNWKDQTPAQLSGMEDYVTIPNTDYWNSAAYQQIHDIIEYNLRDLNDPAKRIRYVRDYSDIWTAMNDSIYDYPQSGIVAFSPNDTTVVRDSTVYLASNSYYSIPVGHTVDYYSSDWTTCGNMELFRIWGDSNIVVDGGGILYGNSELFNQVNGLLVSNDVNGDSLTIRVSGISVAADSMKNWNCVDVSNAAARYISSNTATSGGFTNITMKVKWTTLGTVGTQFIFSPNTQWNHAFGVWGSKNITVRDIQMNNFAGDGLEVVDSDSVLIDGVTIRTKLRYYVDPFLIGRQGISFVYNAYGSEYGDGSACHPEGKEIYSDTTMRCLKVVNSNIDGGYYAIDFEPNTTGGSMKEIIIDNNVITNDEGGGITTNTSMILEDVIIANNIIDTETYGIFLSSNNASYGIKNLWIVNNKINAGGSAAIYLRGHIQNVYIIGNTITCRDTVGRTEGISIYNAVTNGVMSEIIIRDNIFDRINDIAISAINAGATSKVRGIEFSDNIIVNPGYRTSRSPAYIPYAVYFSGCNQVNVHGNRVYEDSGRGEMYKTFEFVGCDSLVVQDNVTYGAVYSDAASFWACTSYFDLDNTWGYPGGSGSSVSSNTVGYNIIHPSNTHVYKDTCVVDPDSAIYYIQYFGSSGTDSVVYWITATTLDTLLLTETNFDTTIRVYNDTLFVFSSDSITADSLDIRKVLYGEKENYMVETLGDTLAGTGAWTSESWQTWYTYRDVINPRDEILGALVRVWNKGTYGYYAQRSIYELYVNRADGGLVANTGDVTRSFEAVGGMLIPENLILPSSHTATGLDKVEDEITPVAGMVICRNDSVYVYNGSAWKHIVLTGSGVDPTNNP